MLESGQSIQMTLYFLVGALGLSPYCSGGAQVVRVEAKRLDRKGVLKDV